MINKGSSVHGGGGNSLDGASRFNVHGTIPLILKINLYPSKNTYLYAVRS